MYSYHSDGIKTKTVLTASRYLLYFMNVWYDVFNRTLECPLEVCMLYIYYCCERVLVQCQ